MGSWIGPGHQKDRAVIRSLEFPDLSPPTLQRGERGLDMELIIDHAYVRKPSQNPKSMRVPGISR